jgi:hypothetical protein
LLFANNTSPKYRLTTGVFILGLKPVRMPVTASKNQKPALAIAGNGPRVPVTMQGTEIAID